MRGQPLGSLGREARKQRNGQCEDTLSVTPEMACLSNSKAAGRVGVQEVRGSQATELD